MRARIFAEENRKWWTLGAVAFGLFMIMLDNTVVFVALSAIQSDLDISTSELEWVVNGYALTFAVLMLTGGKLADMFGRRRIFIVGLAIFTASSLACGLATGATMLIGARVVQGVGSALMNPATLSIITATFPPRQRGTAIGIWVGVSAMALAIGPLVGGLLTEQINWSWIFFINVPVGILGIIVARLVIDESRDESKEQRLDLPGLISSAVGLFALTYGLIEANNYGWTSARILGSFVGRGRRARPVRRPGAPPARADARPLALPQLDLRRREYGDAARRAGDVRDVLLQLALSPESPRLLGDRDRRQLPADDRADRVDRSRGGEVLRPDRLALADGRRARAA